MNIEEIKGTVENLKTGVFDRTTGTKDLFLPMFEHLFSIIEQAEKALNLAVKHIDGKAEIFSEREKTPVLYQLNVALKSIQGEG